MTADAASYVYTSLAYPDENSAVLQPRFYRMIGLMRRCFLHALFIACLVGMLLPLPAFSNSDSPNLTELQSGWRMTSANNVSCDDSLVSQPSFDASHWYTAQDMPATVLQILQENGVYKDLYFGMNLATPGDLWKQDWWYRTDVYRAFRPRCLHAHLQGNQLPGRHLAERPQGGEPGDDCRHV